MEIARTSGRAVRCRGKPFRAPPAGGSSKGRGKGGDSRKRRGKWHRAGKSHEIFMFVLKKMPNMLGCPAKHSNSHCPSQLPAQ